MSSKITLNQLNSLSASEFRQSFGNIVESWPDAAASVYQSLPVTGFEVFLNLFANYLNGIDYATKETILKLHPDLAGKLAHEGKLTEESTQEQAAAGLNTLTGEQFEQLDRLNQEYKDKFGFPFVICVRQTNKVEAIIAGLIERLRNNRSEELQTGIDEVKKIGRFRVLAIIDYE